MGGARRPVRRLGDHRRAVGQLMPRIPPSACCSTRCWRPTPGRIVGWIAWLGLGRWPVTPYAVLLAGYLGLLAVALILEGVARANRGPLRPVATLLDTALATRPGLWLVWVAWVWVGFHFPAR
jgi:hypothetical protein